MAKKSGIIKVIKGTSKVDTQKYINMKNVKGIADKMEKLYGQYKTSNEPLDIFFKGVKKLKRASVVKNIGSCIAALGLFVPATMVLVRKLEGNKGFQVKKDIEAQLQKSGTQKA